MLGPDRFRYWILIIGLACMTSLSSNTFTFNIAQVCMDTRSNITFLEGWPPIDYTQNELSQLNAMVGIGQLIGTVLFTELYTRVDTKWTFFTAGVVSSFVTLIMPFVAEFDFVLMIILRFIQGLAYGAMSAGMGEITATWASLKQNGLFVSVLSMEGPISGAITYVVGGMMCNSRWGWPLIFYSHAFAGAILFVLWAIFYDMRPEDSKRVTKIELEKIQRHKSQSHISGNCAVPYKKILMDPVQWMLWFNCFVEFLATNFLAVYAAFYIRYVLHYGIESSGTWSSVTRFLSVPSRFVCAILSDKITSISEGAKLDIFNTFAAGGACICYIALVFVSNDIAIIALFGLVNLVTGAATLGMFKCSSLYSRQFGHFALSMAQVGRCLAVFIAPVMVSAFVEHDESMDEWRWIFGVIAVLLFACAVHFLWYSTADPALYTLDPQKVLPQLEPNFCSLTDFPKK